MASTSGVFWNCSSNLKENARIGQRGKPQSTSKLLKENIKFSLFLEV